MALFFQASLLIRRILSNFKQISVTDIVTKIPRDDGLLSESTTEVKKKMIRSARACKARSIVGDCSTDLKIPRSDWTK